MGSEVRSGSDTDAPLNCLALALVAGGLAWLAVGGVSGAALLAGCFVIWLAAWRFLPRPEWRIAGDSLRVRTELSATTHEISLDAVRRIETQWAPYAGARLILVTRSGEKCPVAIEEWTLPLRRFLLERCSSDPKVEVSAGAYRLLRQH